MLLDLLHAAGHRGAIAVLAVADEAGAAAERAVREFGDDPAVRRVCHAVVPVAPATAVAAARLGDDEHRWLRQWVATHAGADGGPTRPWRTDSGIARRAARPPRPARRAPGPAAGAVRRGGTRAELAGALVRHSGSGGAAGADRVAVPQPGRRAAQPVRAGRARRPDAGGTPPTDDGHRLQYQLERVRAGAHELRELELLDVLRSGELHLPDEQRYAAERLLGADGDDSRARLGLGADATAEQVRAAAAARRPAGGRSRPTRWSSARVRDAAQVLVWTCERLAAEAADAR